MSPRENFENMGENLCNLVHFWDIRSSSKVGRKIDTFYRPCRIGSAAPGRPCVHHFLDPEAGSTNFFFFFFFRCSGGPYVPRRSNTWQINMKCAFRRFRVRQLRAAVLVSTEGTRPLLLYWHPSIIHVERKLHYSFICRYIKCV